jgi:uncharacterized protein YaaQ
MKMIILILKDQLTETMTSRLTGAKYRVTRIASTGGFLRSGIATLLIGVEDAQVDPAISLIHDVVTAESVEEPQATLFVVPVSRFEQV